MCSAVRRRMLVKGTTLSFWPATGYRAGLRGARRRNGSLRAARAPPTRGLVRERPLHRRLGPVRAFAVDRREHVISGDPASCARPHYLRRVEPVLCNEPADHRGQQLARATLGRRARRALVRRTRTRPGRCPRRGFRLRGLPALAAAARTLLGAGANRDVVLVRCLCCRRGRSSRRRCGRRSACLTCLTGLVRAGPGGPSGTTLAYDGQFGTDGNGLTLLDEDLVDGAADGRGHLRVDLVRRDLEKDLVFNDLVADPLVPFGDGALGNSLTELGHRDFSQRVDLFQPGRALSRRIPPTMMGAVARSGRLLRPWPPS